MVIKCKYAPTIGSEMGMNSNSLGLRNSIDVVVVDSNSSETGSRSSSNSSI